MCTRTPLLCHSRGVKAANHVAPPSVLQHFPYDEWIGLSLIYQTQCVSVCVCATRSEWTITKNLLNSRCSLSAAICLSSIPSFHSQMQRYSSFRVSVSNLPNSPPPTPHLSLCQIETLVRLVTVVTAAPASYLAHSTRRRGRTYSRRD